MSYADPQLEEVVRQYSKHHSMEEVAEIIRLLQIPHSDWRLSDREFMARIMAAKLLRDRQQMMQPPPKIIPPITARTAANELERLADASSAFAQMSAGAACVGVFLLFASYDHPGAVAPCCLFFALAAFLLGVQQLFRLKRLKILKQSRRP